MKSAAVVLLAAAAWAQPPETFEVASIKLGDAMSPGTSYYAQPGGGLRVEHATLKSLVLYAYDLREFQLAGAAGWMNTERYVILAKGVAEGPESYAQMNDQQRRARTALVRKRLQNLLAERFHLAVHRESRELPIYALVVAKGGVKMPVNNGPDTRGVTTGRTIFRATRISPDKIAEALASITGRPVRDETGLTGYYDLDLEWAPEAAASPDAPEKHAEVVGPTLFTALQEKLGLKLESRKGPVEIVVIDSAEKPSEN
jgi:uncharacterized protein (TIGR03435 family)